MSEDGDAERMDDEEASVPVLPKRPHLWNAASIAQLEAAATEHGTSLAAFTAAVQDPAYPLLAQRSAQSCRTKFFGLHPSHEGAPKKRHRATEEPHPASVPPEDGRCAFLDFLNNDVKRLMFRELADDRVALTSLASTCRALRDVVKVTPALQMLMVPLTAKLNKRCVYCQTRRTCNRTVTCVLHHEVAVHHTCFKQRVIGQWHHDLGAASCPIKRCGAQLLEYGKPASEYKKPNQRVGVLKSLFKTAGRAFGYGRHHITFNRYHGHLAFNVEDCAIQ